MQNPFRKHDEEQHRRDRDGDRYETRNRYQDEDRSWSEGDGGRTAQAYRDQGRSDRDFDRNADRSQSGASGWGYGQDQRSEYGRGMSTGYTGDRDYGRRRPSYGSSTDYGADYSRSDDNRGYAQGGRGQGLYDEGSRGGRYGSDSGFSGDYTRQGYGQERGGSYGQGRGEQFSGQRDRSYGQNRDYRAGGSSAYPDHGYAPGGQIWESSDRNFDQGRSSNSHHQFEPDYLHWRDQQMSTLDRDYADWRNERREKFASDFDTWRQTRSRDDDRDRTTASASSGQTKASTPNPRVSDVADGGDGDVKKN